MSSCRSISSAFFTYKVGPSKFSQQWATCCINPFAGRLSVLLLAGAKYSLLAVQKCGKSVGQMVCAAD